MLSESNLELRDHARLAELRLEESKSENSRLRANYEEALTKLAESLKVLEEKGRQMGLISQANKELEQRLVAQERECAEQQKRFHEELATKEKELRAVAGERDVAR